MRIASRRGQVTATVFITNTVQAGQLFVPMHYSVANELTFPAFDPYSRQPAYFPVVPPGNTRTATATALNSEMSQTPG